MKYCFWLMAIWFALFSGSTAMAAERYPLDIPATTLDRAIDTFSRQTGASVGGMDIQSASTRTKRVRGRYTLRQGLRTMLRGTNLDFSIIDSSTVRIFRKARRPKRATRPRSPPRPKVARPRPVPPPPVVEIVVTATKQETRLEDYPGTATVVSLDANPLSLEAEGIEALVRQLPTASETNLGPGRNKIFLRGIADSSFNGTSQSTLALYLGDTRLAYSSPNPDLRLYDVERVEILEGPQGTLYGAGSLGGTIRIVPNLPDNNAVGGGVWSQLSFTDNGDPSADLAGMINVPLTDGIAVRGLGYVQKDGGYIDDAQRDLSNINRANIEGGRASLRADIGDDWTIDAGLAFQNIRTRDNQYAERSQPPLKRRSAISQPFDSDFASYSIGVTKKWSTLSLVSSTGIVQSEMDTRFDATPLSIIGEPTAFDEQRKIRLINHETRLSGRDSSEGSWVVGVSLIDNRDQVIRSLGDPDDPPEIANVLASTTEVALFGELSQPIVTDVVGTVGARFVYTSFLSETNGPDGTEIDPTRSDFKILPTLALAWEPDDKGIIYGRYQKGYRGGGISTGDGQVISIERFQPDDIDTFELGVRWKMGRDNQFSAGTSIFYSKWKNIQADLIDPLGFPRTANIGDGKVYGLSTGFQWQMTSFFSVFGKFFFNESELTMAAPGFIIGEDGRLPNIGELGGSAGFRIAAPISDGLDASWSADMRYVGTSQLGIDPFIALEQSGYATVGLNAALQSDNWTLFSEVLNLLNSKANSFSLGNPFAVADGQQITPLRPRTVSIGFKAKF